MCGNAGKMPVREAQVSYEAYIGKEYPPFTVEVEKGRLLFFAKAVGSDDPVYTDQDAARAAGYPGLPAPPTFAFSITMDAGQSFNVLEDMEIPLPKAVHGAQGFAYHRPIIAGDTISGRQKITNIFEKKGGALLFIETLIELQNQRSEPVCDLTSTIVVRNG